MALYGVNQIGGPNPGGNPTLGPMMGSSTPQQLLGDAQLATTLYGEIGQQAAMTGQATALGIQATGAAAEAGQYDTAAGIAEGNAQLALVGGDIEKYQAMRQVQKTIGAQRATGAASGFADAGSALDVARSSLQQGLLQTQLIGTNADLKAGGYLEQAASAQAEASAAGTASAYASSMSASAAAQAANMTNTINLTKQFIGALPGGEALLPGANGKPPASSSGGFVPGSTSSDPNYMPTFNGTRWV